MLDPLAWREPIERPAHNFEGVGALAFAGRLGVLDREIDQRLCACDRLRRSRQQDVPGGENFLLGGR